MGKGGGGEGIEGRHCSSSSSSSEWEFWLLRRDEREKGGSNNRTEPTYDAIGTTVTTLYRLDAPRSY